MGPDGWKDVVAAYQRKIASVIDDAMHVEQDDSADERDTDN